MIRRALLACVFIASGFMAGMVLTGKMRSADESSAAPASAIHTAVPQPGSSAAPVGPAMGGLPDLSSVAARAVPSVMNISSLRVEHQTSPFAVDPLFRYFFGDPDEIPGYGNRISQSLGSGVVVSSDGYVLTNNHVVGDPNAQVSIVLPDKRELKSKVVGVDPMTDIALLKIDARGLPVLPWGDSSKLKVAEWVLAIGNPFQLSQTVTLGIVSATGRTLEGRLATYEDFIQTDAAINPGNSGGALVNARGELVGINTAIFSETGGYEGIGFAVPSNLAKHVMDDLIRFGEVQRGAIPGIQLMALTTQDAEYLGAPNTRGALVAQMARRSDAWAAGLRPGDIIISFNGHGVDDVSQLQRLIADSKVGTTARVEVLRQSRHMMVNIPITRPAPPRRAVR
jgi:Do/DeqQ family serine protease